MRTARLASWAALLAGLAPGIALAYIPPSGFIVKSMVQKHSAFAGVQIKSRVTVYEGGKPSPQSFKVTTVFNARESRLFSVATDSADRRLYATEKKVSAIPPAGAVLFLAQSRAVAQILVANGISLTEAAPEAGTDSDPLAPPPVHPGGVAEGMSLTRWRDSSAWVIGGRKGSQLWVEKDTFLPLRLLFAGGGQAASALEIRFDSTRFFKEFPYPKLIGLYKGGVPLLQDEVLEITPYPESKGLKTPTLPGLKLPSTGMTEDGNSAPRELREAVAQYYEFVR
jgi:hypothetical protein